QVLRKVGIKRIDALDERVGQLTAALACRVARPQRGDVLEQAAAQAALDTGRRTRRAGGLQPGRPRAAYRSGEQQQEARLGVGQRVAAKKNAAHDAAEQPRLCDHQHGVEYSGSNRDDEVETRDPCFSKQASVEVHESKIRQVSGREGVSPQMSQMEPQCYLCPSVLSVGSFK